MNNRIPAQQQALNVSGKLKPTITLTQEEFVKQFYLEKKRLVDDAFNANSNWQTSTQIASLNLDKEQTEKFKNIISGLLTDTFYTILLGLDGAGSIGNNQTDYKIQDEDDNELSGGEIEGFAYEYFHDHKLELTNSKADFVATLAYKKAEEGGRTTPAYSGYRAQIKFGFTEMQTSGEQKFINREMVFPGDTLVDTEIKLTSPDLFAGQLKHRTKFEIREGPTIIATGEVKQILNETLRQASR